MSSLPEIRRSLQEKFKQNGLTGRGSIWSWRGEGLRWIVKIDRPPYGESLAIDIGVEFGEIPTARRPNECPIMLYLESLGALETLGYVSAGTISEGLAGRALDAASTLSDEERDITLSVIAKGLSEYIRARPTRSDIERAYVSEEFRQGFVHREFRASIPSSPGDEE